MKKEKNSLPVCKSLILEDIDNLPHTPFTDRKRVMRVARMQIYISINIMKLKLKRDLNGKFINFINCSNIKCLPLIYGRHQRIHSTVCHDFTHEKWVKKNIL